MTSLTIGLILPDVLGTYGDDGNALVLRQRARMRGIDAEIQRITLDDAVPSTLDIYCLGGGEDTAQILATEHLAKHDGLQTAAAAGRPIFAVCAGMQVLGEFFCAAGRVIDGLGLLDVTTVSLQKRAIGELESNPSRAGFTAELTEKLTGFENHMGATLLGADAEPLGQIVRGEGNCDVFSTSDMADAERQQFAEGAVQGSVIATYMHGPAFARNPQLADLLLAKAQGIALKDLPELDIDVVDRLRAERLVG